MAYLGHHYHDDDEDVDDDGDDNGKGRGRKKWGESMVFYHNPLAPENI